MSNRSKRKQELARGEPINRSIDVGELVRNNRIIHSGGSNLAGVRMTERDALGLTAMWQGINIYSTSIAMMSFQCFARTTKGRRLAIERPEYSLVHDSPNCEMSAYKFKQTFVGFRVLWGNAYAQIIRDNYGYAVELNLLHPSRVRPDRINGKLVYIVQGVEQPILAENMIHSAGLGEGVVGYSPIQVAQESLAIAKAIDQASAASYGNGFQPGGVIELPTGVKEDAVANFRHNIEQQHEGSAKSGVPLILPPQFKWISTAFTPKDQELLVSRNFSIAEVARILNMPQYMLGNLDHATFSNIDAQFDAFYKMSLLPIVEEIEQEFNFKLFSSEERQTYYVEHNFESFLRGDSTTRKDFYRELFNIGVFSINDIRQFENQDPIENGDSHYVPSTMKRVEDYLVKDTAEAPPVATLLQVVTAVTSQGLPALSARILLQTAYPQLTPEQIDGLISPLQVIAPPPAEVPPVDNAPARDALRQAITETVGRMVRREVGSIKKAVKRSPETMLDWLQEFTTEHASIFAQSLDPLTRALGSLDGRSIDSTQLAIELVNHEDIVELVKSVEPSELGPAVDRLVDGWESSKVDMLVNSLFGGQDNGN